MVIDFVIVIVRLLLDLHAAYKLDYAGGQGAQVRGMSSHQVCDLQAHY